MLAAYFHGRFKKDLKLMQKRGYDISKVYEIIAKIIWQEPLPEHCRPHGLSGDLDGFTECHALNDLLLMYLLDGENVVFSRAGTHSDLF